MKHIFRTFVASLLLGCTTSAMAQECDIPMAIAIDGDFSNLTAEATSVLQTQLERAASQSKVNVGWDNARFAITAKFDQTDRYVVGGAPTQIVNKFGVTLYLADVYNQKLFGTSYVEVQGVGNNETKSCINAIRQLTAQNATVSSFFSTAKKKVVNYYDSQLDNIIRDARGKAAMDNYEEAMAMLAVVPSCCNGYERAMKEALKYYEKYCDRYYLAQLNKAKALWAANPTQEGAQEVLAILGAVDPEAKCYPQAQKMIQEVGKSVKTDVDYENKTKYKDAVELEKFRINAIAEIGKAYASNRPQNFLFLR